MRCRRNGKGATSPSSASWPALPQAYERGVRFEFDVERVLTPEARVPRHIVLSWWGSPARDGRPATFPPLEPGERWQLTVRLKRPHGTANPHGFDYEAWLFERNLRATGYVRPRTGGHRLADDGARARSTGSSASAAAIRARILAALADAPYAGVIAALAIGDQRAIPPEQWQTFTRTGVNHLMSISGLHVTMVSGLVFALVCGLWRRVPRLTLALAGAQGGGARGPVRGVRSTRCWPVSRCRPSARSTCWPWSRARCGWASSNRHRWCCAPRCWWWC